MYDEILQALISMAETAAGVQVFEGSLPPDNGLAMTGNASEAAVFLDIGSDESMSILCNGKHREQQTVTQQLDEIHRYLTRRKTFPQGNNWQIYAIETVASPRLINHEPNGQWVYGSSLLVKINVKGI